MKKAIIIFSICLFLVAAGLVLADAPRAHPAATTEPQTLAKVEIGLAAEKGVALKGGVSVTIASKDGIQKVSIKSKAVTHSDDYSRDVIVYVTQPKAIFTIVADRFASDEDRLIVYDMDDKVASLTISHDSTDSYSHQHYRVTDVKGSGVALIEEEYDGDNAPRKRTLLLTKGNNGFKVATGKWEHLQ